MIRKAGWVFFGVAVLAALSPSQKYAQRSVPIRAGVVLLDSQQPVAAPGYADNLSPYVWFNLDSNKNVKPNGWTFYNPVAATSVTPEINTRWTLVDSAHGYGLGPAYAGNESITKRDAAYWEVALSKASDAQITSFDILHLSAYGHISLNSLEQQKLRKFMEGGGVLWVDVKSGSLNLDAINGLPLPFNVNTTSSGAPADADFLHPLLSSPNVIGFDSLFSMQSDIFYGLRDVNLTTMGFPDVAFIQKPTEGDFSKFLPIAADNLGPAILLGQVGDGFLVVTSRGVATTLNRTQSGGSYVANNAHRAYDPLFDRTSDAAAKLAVNMAYLTSGHAQMAKGSRKENGTPIDIGAPLLKRFNHDLDLSAANLAYRPPVIFQGLAIVSTTDRIVVYDANPSSDLDGDGNPDDGIPDFGIGSNVDEVWESAALGGPISAPAACEVANPTGAPKEQIAVTDAAGNLWIFDAFPANPGLGMAGVSIAPPAGTSAADTGQLGPAPFSPSYHDGLIFVTDEASAGLGGIVGRVWIADARNATGLTGAARWQAGGAASGNIGRPSGGAVIGYIPIADNSGGTDLVAYVPTRANVLAQTNAGVYSLWIGVKGEKPTSFTEIPGSLIVNTRASGQGLDINLGGPADSLGVRLTVIKATGDPMDATELNTYFMGASPAQASGILTFSLKAPLPLGVSFRLDYTIDWGTGDPAKTQQLLRGQIFLPDDNNHTKRILHDMALSPQGTLHLVHSNQGDTSSTPLASRFGGAFYSFREEGRGAFRLLNRYELYPSHTFSLNQANQVTVQETLSDRDEVQTAAMAMTGGIDFIGGRFSNLVFEGGPAIHNGVVYVTARGSKTASFVPGGVPCSVLMAFQADPDIPQIYVGDLSGSFTILQPDVGRSDVKNLPNQYSTLQPTQYVYEREPGADRGTIRMDNLMSTTRGPMQNALSRSQPIIIRRSGQPDQLIEPDRSGTRWSPLLWYSVYHGIQNQSPPTVTGNTVFMAGASALPNILQSGGTNFLPTGVLSGQDSDVSPTDAFLVADPARPWLKQLWSLKVAPTFKSNPDFRWPQSQGVNSFQTWAIRLIQTTLTNKVDALGVVAGDGVLLSWAPTNGARPGGIFGFSKADFIVADEGRIARFDPAGNPIWASDSALLTGTSLDVGSAAEVKPLVRATRAYAINSKEMLVTDTGADRVLRMDTSGRELRAIDKFRLDTNAAGVIGYTPDGYQSNEPLTLKAPRDILAFNTYVVAGANSLTNPQPLELWVHHVIADSGNKRIIELVDRYAIDAVTRRNLGVVEDGPLTKVKQLAILYWHSPSSFTGKNFTYSSLARVFIEDTVTPANSRWVYAAGIGSSLPTRVDTGLDSPAAPTVPAVQREGEGGNGGIVVFDGANSQVINEVEVPAIPANILYNKTTGLFDDPGRAARTALTNNAKKLSNLTSVSMRNILVGGASRVAIMFTDSEGVFEIIQPAANGPWVVDWMLPREVYRVMRRTAGLPDGTNVDLRANYARRLDSGEVLVVNGYFGKTRGGAEISGEVLQVDGEADPDPLKLGYDLNKINLGFQTFSIRFELPPISGARGLIIPVFADRR